MSANRRAEMGVGTLIIFIALLLVAAVAAGVLLQTAGSLQQQALAVGDQSRTEISTHVRIIEVSAIDGTNQDVENFSMQAKLAPGSDPIKLEQTTVTLNTDNSTTTYTYSGSLLHTVNATTGEGTYGVEYLINGTNHIDGNLQRGDIIRVYMLPPHNITESEQVRINLIPKSGTATLIEFSTPDVISTERVYLYPT